MDRVGSLSTDPSLDPTLAASMPHLFTCPHCQTQTMVDDQYSGHRGECVTCGKPIEVPRFILPATPVSPPAPRTQGLARSFRPLAAILVSALLIVAVSILAIRYGTEGIEQLRINVERGRCQQNLEKIAAALNAYARDYGSYPPPLSRASDGTSLHSWRVLILPYLGYSDLHSRLALDEPWNSPTNQALLGSMPAEYRSPALANVTGAETHYFLITGKGTLFPATGPLGPDDVTDDPRTTVLVVESGNFPPASQWLEPVDIDADTAQLSIGEALGGSHQGGMTLSTVDGRAHWLPAGVEPGVIRSLVTPQGGEGIRDDLLQ